MSGATRRPLVFVVDDEAGSRLLARTVLESQGFRVEEAGDGAMALAQLERLKPDLVLLDVVMPELDGFEVCRRLRLLPGGCDVPVLMLTGLDDVESINRAYDVGATDFAVKPIQWPLLGHRVRYVLRAARTLSALRISEARLSKAQRIARLGHWSLELSSGRLDWSDTMHEIFGTRRDQYVPTHADYLELVHPEDRERVEVLVARLGELDAYELDYRIVRPDGELRHLQERAEVRRDDQGRPSELEGVVHDVTERRLAEAEAQFLARHDALTRLPNRAQLLERLRTDLARSLRNGQTLAVLVIDIDRFKSVNDTLGHRAGDELLCGVAERLTSCLQAGDSREGHGDAALGAALARFGGDEFTLIVPDLADPRDAARLAERVQRALSPGFAPGGREMAVSASIGISVAPQDGEDAEALLANAGLAMRHVKQTATGRYGYFDRSMNEATQRRIWLESGLRRALEGDELLLHYQPLVNGGREVIGFEALARWPHPEGGPTSPAEFVPVAEECGLIHRLGDWVLREGCRRLASLRRASGRPLTLGINVSARQLRETGFSARVAATLAENDLPPEALCVEITESVLMEDGGATRDELRRLKELGVRVAIDDFGMGFSSLSYLSRLPIDTLKIDRSFVRDLPSCANAVAIVSAILALARGLGLGVVAEGVESEAQERFLRLRGCEQMQGYLFGRPELEPCLAEAS